MASVLKVTVTTELDGVRVESLCQSIQTTYDEAQQFSVERPTAGSNVAMPIGELTTLQALVMTASQALTLQFGATAEADITLAADGLVVLLGVTNTASNAKTSNASGSTAILAGIAAGT